MTEFLSVFGNWKKAPLSCEKCGWQGIFEQGGVEYWDEVIDCHCPQCPPDDRTMLAVVCYPTLEEARQRWYRLPWREWLFLRQILAFREKLAAARRPAKQSWPEIADAAFVLHWDIRGREPSCQTVIRQGERILHREPAVFEGLLRYAELARQLRRHYGPALRDLMPTAASETYLFGDDLLAPQRLQELRAEIFELAGTGPPSGPLQPL